MIEMEQAIQIQEKVKVGDELLPALPFNTIDEVYVDVGKNIMLREKLTDTDIKIDTVKSETDTTLEKVNRIENTVTELQTSVGEGGNLSQEITNLETSTTAVKEGTTLTTESVENIKNELTNLQSSINEHSQLIIDSEEGVHGFKVINGVLYYEDNGVWREIKTGGTDLELIKHALSGKISLNQFIIRKANSTVLGGCYRDGFYFLNNITPRYKTVTAHINLDDSNPETAVRYAGNVGDVLTPGSSDWDEFFGHYPCLFKNGAEVGELQKNDFKKFLDSTSADITTGNAGDLMIAFPRLGLNISTEGRIISVSMTNNPDDPNFKYYAHTRGDVAKSKFYLGAYDGVVLNGKLRSLRGKAATTNYTATEMRRYAQANGTGYEQFLFYQLVFIQSMYILKYKSLCSQQKVGMGYSMNMTSFKNTGGTETRGMDWGEQNGSDHMKLFGLEGLWGNVFNWVDGVRSQTIDGSAKIKTTLDNFGNIDNATNIYDSLYNTVLDGWVKSVMGTTECGYIPYEIGGTNRTFFTDRVIGGINNYAFFGGSKHHNTECGIFTFRLNSDTNTKSNLIGARLSFL